MLDCSSFSSTLQSLSSILKVPAEDITGVLLDIDLDQLAEEYRRVMPADVALAKVVCQQLKVVRSEVSFGQTAYFHLTRTWPDEDFSEGLLPLGLVINRVWHKLERTVCPPLEIETFERLRRDGPGRPGDHSWALYEAKTSTRMHWGPYGILIRDVAFEPRNVGNHDYLGIPEIVEDICRSLHRLTGIDVLQRVELALRPGIVKFCTNAPVGDPLPPCLCYLYSRLHGEPLSWLCNNNYDGGGSPIPPDQILGLEWV